MPSTYTGSLRLEKQGIGENSNSWGEKLNQTLSLLDKSIAGHVAVATTGGAVQLTAANNTEDQARYRILEITGTLASNATIEVPAASKEYVIWDSTVRGGFTLVFRLGAAGDTVTVPAVTARAFGISTDGTNWRPLSGDLASATSPGIVELATDTEAQTGTDTERALTPANLQAVTATLTRKGVVELATDTEAQTGTDTERALTPANLQAITATLTRKGIVELASLSETQIGTDTVRAVTPAVLAAVLSIRVYRAANAADVQALPAGSGYQVHLSGAPSGSFEFRATNLSTEVAGDPSKTTHIAPGSDLTGASGAWVKCSGPEVGDLSLFSGTTAGMNRRYLQGWRLANGVSGTPNLQDSFPKMGTFAQKSGTGGSNTVTPAGGVTVSTSVSVANHTLTTAQIPSHRHSDSLNNSTSGTSNIQTSGGGSQGTVFSDFEGGDGAHNHGASASSSGSFSGTTHTNEPKYFYFVPLYFTGIAGTYP
jgi:microcystin-dependent protein